MFDFNLDGWTYGPILVIVILYFLWRFLRPSRNKRDRGSRDFRTRYQERKRSATRKESEKDEDLKPYRER